MGSIVFDSKEAQVLTAPPPSATPHWELFRHDADIGVRGFGPTRESAFEQAALALIGVITDPAQVRTLDPVPVACDAPDDELLLADWLNAIIYKIAVQHMLFGRFQVTIVDGHLEAIMWGEPVDIPRHQPAVEIKAASYAELSVRHSDETGWVAQSVVDV